MGKRLLPGMKTTSRQAFFTVQTLKTTVRRKSVETIVSRSYDEPGMTAAFERRAGDGGQWVERSV